MNLKLVSQVMCLTTATKIINRQKVYPSFHPLNKNSPTDWMTEDEQKQ